MKLHTHSEISIHCSPEQLFQLVTTPDNWVGQHPMTVRVSGDTHHSLKVGEQCIEEVRVGFGGVDEPRLSANWHVTRRQAPLLWEIKAQFPAQLPLPGLQHARGSLTVIHHITDTGHGNVLWQRDMETEIASDLPVPDEVKAMAQDPRIHDVFLANVKALLETTK